MSPLQHLGTNVVPLGRNPFLLAKELAQLDQISGGRLLLCVVTGLGQSGERQALGLLAARRPDVDPLAFVPVGRTGLRDFVEGYVGAGLSKFVVRPLAPSRPGPRRLHG